MSRIDWLNVVVLGVIVGILWAIIRAIFGDEPMYNTEKALVALVPIFVLGIDGFLVKPAED